MVRVCGYPLIYLIVTAAPAPSCARPYTFPATTSGATPSCTLHAHLTSWLQASDAIGSVVHKGSQALLSLSRVQPPSLWRWCLLLGLVSSGPNACLVDSTV